MSVSCDCINCSVNFQVGVRWDSVKLIYISEWSFKYTLVGMVISSLEKFAPVLRPLQKLELLDIRGTCAKCRYVVSCCVLFWTGLTDLMPADNGFPFSLSAQLSGELPKCRIRITTCNLYATVIMIYDNTHS